MLATCNALIVGQNDKICHDLRRKLIKSGIECPATFPANEGTQGALSQLPSLPDVIFIRSDKGSALNSALFLQLRRQTQVEIIAVGDITDSREIMQLIRAGATDYLHESELHESALLNIVSRIKYRNSISPDQQKGKVISVISASGGCGASTIAVNLAAAFINRNIKNILIDLKQDGGDLTAILNLKPTHSIIDLSQQIEELDEEMLDKSLADHHSGIRLLACSSSFENAGLVHPEEVERIVQLAKYRYGNVIIDVEDVYHREQQAAIRNSDDILLAIRLDLACLVRARRMLEYLERIGIQNDRIKLIANRYGRKNELPKNTIIKALGKPFSHFLPEDYGLAVLSANVGNPIVNESPNSQLAKALLQIADSLILV